MCSSEIGSLILFQNTGYPVQPEQNYQEQLISFTVRQKANNLSFNQPLMKTDSSLMLKSGVLIQFMEHQMRVKLVLSTTAHYRCGNRCDGHGALGILVFIWVPFLYQSYSRLLVKHIKHITIP